MKVICIEDCVQRFDEKTGEQYPLLNIKFGETYTVVNQTRFDTFPRIVYQLAEFPPNPKGEWFDSKMFAIVSEIDETELVNQKEEAYV